VLMNLVGTASASAPAGSVVDLRVEMAQPLDRNAGGAGGAPRAERIRVVVRSAGAPVAAAEAVLGLAVARAIVRAHGGRLEAEGATGGRTRYWFELPRLSHGGTPERPAPPRQ